MAENKLLQKLKGISEIVVKTATKGRLHTHYLQYELYNSKCYETEKIKLVTALCDCYSHQEVSTQGR